MPHVIIKLMAGRTEEQKSRLAAEVTKAVMAGATCTEDAVSVSITDIGEGHWMDDVYQTDIAGDWDRLYKKPGYGPMPER